MKIDRIALILASKWVGLCRRWQFRKAQRFTARCTPELLTAYTAFSQSQQSGSPRQPFKGWDLWKILQTVEPKSIVELGSGTTSAVFALWSKKFGASYTAYEHHREWARVTCRCLNQTGLVPTAGSGVVCVSTQLNEDQSSIGFEQPLPSDVDLLYVDGPPCLLENGRKVPNDDATRLLDRGIFPKAIVVDGRVETVELLSRHPAIVKYVLKPGLAYCLRKGLFLHALAGREHSVFLRK